MLQSTRYATAPAARPEQSNPVGADWFQLFGKLRRGAPLCRPFGLGEPRRPIEHRGRRGSWDGLGFVPRMSIDFCCARMWSSNKCRLCQFMALSWLNLPCAIKAAIVMGKQTLAARPVCRARAGKALRLYRGSKTSRTIATGSPATTAEDASPGQYRRRRLEAASQGRRFMSYRQAQMRLRKA